jgi:hypothetical protein
VKATSSSRLSKQLDDHVVGLSGNGSLFLHPPVGGFDAISRACWRTPHRLIYVKPYGFENQDLDGEVQAPS